MPKTVLATLQPSANNQSLVGATRQRLVRKQINKSIKINDENVDAIGKLKNKGKEGAQQDKKELISTLSGPDDPFPTTTSTSTNTDVSLTNQHKQSEDDIKNMLLGCEPSAQYWKELAEERGTALKEALDENLALCQQLARLNEEKRNLQFLADQGKQFAYILQQAMNNNEDDDE